jgi:hypothetical protein
MKAISKEAMRALPPFSCYAQAFLHLCCVCSGRSHAQCAPITGTKEPFQAQKERRYPHIERERARDTKRKNSSTRSPQAHATCSLHSQHLAADSLPRCCVGVGCIGAHQRAAFAAKLKCYSSKHTQVAPKGTHRGHEKASRSTARE